MKTLHISFLLMIFALFFSSCSEDEKLVFEHEKPQFELQSGSILVEVVVPRNTLSGEDIYIVGDFNGGENAIGNSNYKLTVSSKTQYRWGVYLNPADFETGKSLSDGFWFVASQSGIEKSSDCTELIRTESASAGTRLECKIAKWYAECYVPIPDGEWPAPESGKIMLKFQLPEYTPENAKILLYGFVNGWNGSDVTKWQTVKLTKTKHYIMLNPSDFAEGTSLADQFKFGLMMEGKEWWYHQSNEDGGATDGAGYRVENAVAGQAYDITILGWRSSNELPKVWPSVPEGKIMLRILLPGNTPMNPKILLYGFINGWNGSSDETKWKTTELEPGKHYMILNPADFSAGTSLADQFKFGLMVTGKEWWYHQSNEDGGGNDGAGYTIPNTQPGSFYEVTIGGWRNSSEL